MSNSKIFINHSSIKLLLLFAALYLSLYGCYTIRFYHDTDMLREKPDGEISVKSSIINITQVDEPAQIRSACPSGASFVEIEQTMSDGLINYMSLGFYSTQTARVWCKRRERKNEK